MQNKSKTTILLGAGAMIPYGGPKTEELSDRLLVNSSCRQLFEHIKNDIKGTCNFETMLCALEQILEWKIAASNSNSDNDVFTKMLKPCFEYKNTFSRSDLWAIYVEAVNEIIERVKEYDCYPPSCPIKREELANFILNKSRKSALKIYTLNYDRLIPKIINQVGGEIYEGISNQEFNYDIEKFVNHKLTHFNLHGSIYNDYKPGKGVTLSDEPIDFYHQYFIEGGNPQEQKIFLPIITGYSKSQRIISEPFNFGLGAFMYDCNTSDRIVVAGYSFGDPHINSILKKFVKKDSTDIVIIDYSKNHTVLPECFRDYAYQVFNIPQSEFDTSKDGEYKEISSRLSVYLKGFETYIKEDCK